jgi:hypothetical protein
MISADMLLEGIYSGGGRTANSMSANAGNLNPFSLKVFGYNLCSKSCKWEKGQGNVDPAPS